MTPNDNPIEVPQALLLGEIHHAKDAFKRLQKSCHIKQITNGTRSQFLADCDAGIYNNVMAIGRTVDSMQFTGLFDAELVARLPSSVKFICHNGAGYDQVDVQACISRGIAVSNTPSVVNDATADTTMLLLLAALRRAWAPQSALRQGLWGSSTTTPLGRDPTGLTLGILGLGGIGAAVARRAAAFGLRLQYHNRSGPAQEPVLQNLGAGVNATYVTFAELLATSDIISLHVPLAAETRHLIGPLEIDQMKDGVVLINTARGPVVDEDALVAGLALGKVWSAGLDVFEHEPEVHPGLLANANVVLLPHIGTATVDTRKRMEVLLLENVQSAISQKRLLTPVPECIA